MSEEQAEAKRTQQAERLRQRDADIAARRAARDQRREKDRAAWKPQQRPPHEPRYHVYGRDSAKGKERLAGRTDDVEAFRKDCPGLIDVRVVDTQAQD